MVGNKRKASGSSPLLSKRARASTATLSLTENQLTELSKTEIIQYTIAVQKQRDDAILQRDNYPGPKAYAPEEVDSMMKQSRQMVVDGIARLFEKWSPSCSNGFTYECHVSSPYIYKLTLGLRSRDRRKTFKMSIFDFKNTVGYPEARVGSDVIVLTDRKVNVCWDSNKSIYTISGTFGKSE